MSTSGSTSLRRTLLTVVVALAVVLGLATAVVATGGDSSVTRPRLERSVSTTFANLDAQQATILGHPGITPASLHARTMCDKGGATSADEGPGGSWICLVSWTDPNVPMPPEGYGKFELNVHSNDCYTVSGPSKLVGFLTINDTSGTVVTNPVFEFDGCFDPHGDDAPTGVVFPSLFQTLSTTETLDPQRRAGLEVSCGTGSAGCSGTMVARSAGVTLGTTAYHLDEETTQTLSFPAPVPAGATQVRFQVTMDEGTGSADPVTLPLQP